MARCMECGGSIAPHTFWKFLCLSCISRLSWASRYCKICGKPSVQTPCGACLITPPLQEATRHVFWYEDPIPEMVHHYKYGLYISFSIPFSYLLAQAVLTLPFSFHQAPIIPVPSHPLRRLQRGFEPVYFLVQHVCKLSHHPIWDGLRKVRHVSPQARKSAGERKKLPKNLFTLSSMPPSTHGILLDDVYTTGTTLQRCMEVLQQGGVRHIAVITLARTL